MFGGGGKVRGNWSPKKVVKNVPQENVEKYRKKIFGTIKQKYFWKHLKKKFVGAHFAGGPGSGGGVGWGINAGKVTTKYVQQMCTGGGGEVLVEW